jgi:rhodanese-related sulfurtransferase
MIDSHEFISARSLHERMQGEKSVILIDVREPAEYNEKHAKGAISMPVKSIGLEQVQQRFPEWNPNNDPVYLVCESGMRALQAAETLYWQGAKYPVVVEGGTESLIQAGIPSRRKPGLLSLERQTQIALGIVLLAVLVKGALIHPGFYLLTGLIATGLIFAGITARCSLSMLLAKMPWNQQSGSTA